jgi:hypothetical protein
VWNEKPLLRGVCFMLQGHKLNVHVRARRENYRPFSTRATCITPNPEGSSLVLRTAYLFQQVTLVEGERS